VTRVKICGITRPGDAVLAAELGAHAIGLNFFRGPRQIEPAQGLVIINALPPMITPVGLVDHIVKTGSTVTSAVSLQRELNIRTFQTYSSGEQHALPATLNEQLDWWAVVPVASPASIKNLRALVSSFNTRPQGLVLDTYAIGQTGGTGQTFNWQWLAEAREAGDLAGLPPIILAGGLNPDNVAEAIRIARPWAVDVSSGVEPANTPGQKDPVKMRDFIQAVLSSNGL